MVVVEDKKVQVARAKGFVYIWRVELLDGRIYEQFDSAGTEYPLIDHNRGATLMLKDPEDPYYGWITIQGIKRGGWIPVADGYKPCIIEVGDAEGLTLFRKTYRGAGKNALNYFVYVAGIRKNGVENAVWICPPTMCDGLLFKGGVSQGTDPAFKNAFDEWMDSNNHLAPPTRP